MNKIRRITDYITTEIITLPEQNSPLLLQSKYIIEIRQYFF